jgi:hypothetical protein
MIALFLAVVLSHGAAVATESGPAIALHVGRPSPNILYIEVVHGVVGRFYHAADVQGEWLVVPLTGSCGKDLGTAYAYAMTEEGSVWLLQRKELGSVRCGRRRAAR